MAGAPSISTLRRMEEAIPAIATLHVSSDGTKEIFGNYNDLIRSIITPQLSWNFAVYLSIRPFLCWLVAITSVTYGQEDI